MSQRLQCPVCHEPQFVTRVDRLDLAYFGEVLQFSMKCDDCGFRRVDLHVVNESEPIRYELAVTEADDLAVRVVRSASGHFEVPELGIRATPAQASDAFVSNVEGVLDRCLNALEAARNGAETGEMRERVDARIEQLDRLRSLDEPWTVIVEDPLGNSAIVSEKAERRVLSKEEAEALGLPYIALDAKDLEGFEGP